MLLSRGQHTAQTAGLSRGHQNIPEAQVLPKAELWEKAGAVEGIEEPSLREERCRQLDTYPSTAGPWT